MSDLKQWILVILFFNILLLPLMWVKQDVSKGKVLGVLEQTEQTQASDNIQNKIKTDKQYLPPSNIRVLDNSVQSFQDGLNTFNYNSGSRLQNQYINSDQKVQNGKIIFRDGFRGKVAIKNANLADKVKIQANGKTVESSVDSTVLMPEGVIAVVSADIFSSLGGDLTTQKEIEGVVTKI